jgi:hypothetical protein
MWGTDILVSHPFHTEHGMDGAHSNVGGIMREFLPGLKIETWGTRMRKFEIPREASRMGLRAHPVFCWSRISH